MSVLIIVAARNEADRIGATIEALADAFPGAEIWVGDDASSDATAKLAAAAGARVVRAKRSLGKGGNATAAARAALGALGEGANDDEAPPAPEVALLCDGDLAASAGRLRPLTAAVESGDCDLAVAAFAHRVGGGVGAARGAGRWAIRRACGLDTQAPLSGQRAMSV
ncbi:MAG: glycosyltransferase, partial [Solirubrobacterales bacterium]